MNEFTFEERNLLCIYNRAGTRTGLIASLEDMRGYLEPFEAVDLYPDFDPEDPAYGK